MGEEQWRARRVREEPEQGLVQVQLEQQEQRERLLEELARAPAEELLEAEVVLEAACLAPTQQEPECHQLTRPGREMTRIA